MSGDLISRSELLAELSARLSIVQRVGVDEIVMGVPAVDAVEVVRCKDCEWYSPGDGPQRGRCLREDLDIGAREGYRFYVREWDFCPYGKRKVTDV